MTDGGARGAGSPGVSLRAFFVSDARETIRARWYQVYVLGFTLLLGAFFAFGLADSSVMGFTGLTRILLTFIQAAIVVLPLFVLISTARTLVADREAGVWEYLLSWPVSLGGYFWGKALGRLVTVTAPLLLALLVGAVWGAARSGQAAWPQVIWLSVFLVAMVACFLGIAMLISVLASTQERALGVALALWLAVEALVDALLLGMLVRERLPAEVAVGLALLNPLQSFRTAAMTLFDPQLTTLGPIAWTLLGAAGPVRLRLWAVIWPLITGLVAAGLAARLFRRRDIMA